MPYIASQPVPPVFFMAPTIPVTAASAEPTSSSAAPALTANAIETVTRIWGTPWTTATPWEDTFTQIRPDGRHLVVLNKNYPAQPKAFGETPWCPSTTLKSTSLFAGGLALGLIICCVMMILAAVRIRRLERELVSVHGDQRDTNPGWCWPTARTGAIRLPREKDLPKNRATNRFFNEGRRSR
ncbi:hypothetical protein C8J56DRAFT_889083 [Mycena floridula]|nr:hypothetical protein C8J56DRAFT_889083 [Mycena floridula]